MSTTSIRPSEAAPARDRDKNLGDVARGGSLNLIGAVTYGAANFILVAILTNKLGTDGTGSFLVAIAVFNILSKFGELGSSTGFIRSISRFRALNQQGEIRPTLIIGTVPVVILGAICGAAVYVFAEPLAHLFGEEAGRTDAQNVLRILAPFLVISPLYTALLFGSRGFDTMKPQFFIEKTSKAMAQPIAALIVLQLGFGVRGAAWAWAAPVGLALIPTLLWYRRRMARLAGVGHWTPERVTAARFRTYWAFTLPRAFGQVFQVTVLWFDTLLIAAIGSKDQSAVYGAGTRYMLIGTFTAEAIMQVVGPRMSALLARDELRDADDVFATATAWQTLIIWPVYLVVAGFAVVLLRIFGTEFTGAAPALIALSIAVAIAALFGPSDSVILMYGRSRISLFNTFVAVVINVGGNLYAIPHYGITGAGVVWAITIVVSAVLPAYQAWRILGIHPLQRGTLTAASSAIVSFGTAVLLARLALGQTFPALGAALIAGGVAYAALLWKFRDALDLPVLIKALIRR